MRPLSERLAIADAQRSDDRFAESRRPLVRLDARPGLQTETVRAALALVTRALGGNVDYCLRTPTGLRADTARAMLVRG